MSDSMKKGLAVAVSIIAVLSVFATVLNAHTNAVAKINVNERGHIRHVADNQAHSSSTLQREVAVLRAEFDAYEAKANERHAETMKKQDETNRKIDKVLDVLMK